MQSSNYLQQMMGFVVALALRELLSRTLRLLKGGKLKNPVPWIWSATLLLYIMQFWWALHETNFLNFTFPKFLLMFTNCTLILCACTYILPDDDKELDQYFEKHFRGFLLLCALSIAFAAPANVVIDGESWISPKNIFRSIGVGAILITAGYTHKPWVQKVMAVGLLLTMGVYIGVFSLRLNG